MGRKHAPSNNLESPSAGQLAPPELPPKSITPRTLSRRAMSGPEVQGARNGVNLHGAGVKGALQYWSRFLESILDMDPDDWEGSETFGPGWKVCPPVVERTLINLEVSSREPALSDISIVERRARGSLE